PQCLPASDADGVGVQRILVPGMRIKVIGGAVIELVAQPQLPAHGKTHRDHPHRQSRPADGTQQVVRLFLEWHQVAHGLSPCERLDGTPPNVALVYKHDSAATLKKVCITSV